MSLWNWLEKNPFEAAALGAGIVGTGGALAGAMAPAAAGSGLTLGGAGAAAGMGGGTGLLAGTPAAVAGMGGGGLTGSLPALASGSSGGSLMASMQPYMQALGTASQVKGLLSDNSAPMQAPQVQQGNPAGAQTLAQLYQQGMQMTPEDQARLQRKTMWG